MRKDTLRSLKSHRKDFLLVLVGMLLIYVVVAVILITNAGGGMREIFNHFWPFNEDNIWAYGLTFFIILTAIMYIYALVKEKVFLSKGTKYKGEIVDVIEKSNWRGRGTYVYYLIVKYNDSEQFTSGPYMDNPFFCLENMECVVYKCGNKCCPGDFNMKKDRDVRTYKDVSVCLDNYLIGGIDKGKCAEREFIEGRLLCGIETSAQYLLPLPILAIYNDGKTATIIVDIHINSQRKIRVLPDFNTELQDFVVAVANSVSSEQSQYLGEKVKKKVEELMREHYKFVELVTVEVCNI